MGEERLSERTTERQGEKAMRGFSHTVIPDTGAWCGVSRDPGGIKGIHHYIVEGFKNVDGASKRIPCELGAYDYK